MDDSRYIPKVGEGDEVDEVEAKEVTSGGHVAASNTIELSSTFRDEFSSKYDDIGIISCVQWPAFLHH